MRAKATQLVVVGLVLGVFSITSGSSAKAGFLLNFQDLSNTTSAPTYYNGPYISQGLTLSSTGGFNINGSNSGSFYAGALGLAPIGGSTVDLRETDGSMFSVSSIALARNFLFDNAPSVTFTGTLAGGVTVTQTFTVTTPTGTPAFQTFNFSPVFSNLVSLDFNQPVFSGTGPGLFQFTNVGGSVSVPEPATIGMVAIGMVSLAIGSISRKRSASRSLDC